MPAAKPDRQAPSTPTDDAADTADPQTQDEPANGEDEFVPMNRAERRAKGRSHSGVPAVGKVQPKHVNVQHGPRSYANRRSGG